MLRTASLLFSIAALVSAGSIQDAVELYEQGARNYSISSLKQALGRLSDVPSGQEFDYYLLRGQCYARIQYIYLVADEVSSSEYYGKKALEVLEKAIEENPNSIEAWAAHSIALQNLTGLGTSYGMKYGPMLGSGMNKLKKLDANHFYTRFVDGVWKLRAPSLFGGDRKKALEIFTSLHRTYPNDEDVSLNLATAYMENDNNSAALSLVSSVLTSNPNNLWAQKLKEELE